MQVALLADVHGNAVALDAVLDELDALAPDRVVSLGDVASGPQPAAALDRLRKLDPDVVMGNHDGGLLGDPAFDPRRPGTDESTLELVRELTGWCAEQLSDDQLDYVRTFEDSVAVTLPGGGELRCFHGSPASFEDRIRATTPPMELDGYLGGVEAAVIAVGHTHRQYCRRYDGAVLLNPGSVGANLQTERSSAALTHGPWAEWAVVEVADGSASVDLRRTAFDAEAFVRATRESGMPHADWLVEQWRTDLGLLPNRAVDG